MSSRFPGLFGAALVGACLALGVATPASSASALKHRGAAPMHPADYAAAVSDRRPVPRGTTSALQWAWGNPLPSGDSFQAVAAGNGVYVAAGTSGVLYSSTDGTHWTARKSGVSGSFNYFDVYYANGQFVAGGTDGESISHLTTSPDGVTWTDHAVSLATQEIADHIGYGNGTYVAVNSVALTSTDGVTWHEHDIEPAANQPFFDSPAFANGVFVSLGSDSTTNQVLYLSTDGGATWQQAATSLPITDFMLSLASNGHGFVLTGIDETFSSAQAGVVYTSTDGNTWTRQALAGDGDGFFYPTLWNGSDYVTVSDAFGGGAANVYTSTDGVSWTKGASATLASGYSGTHHPIAWTGSGYLATGTGALQLQSSADYAAWSSVFDGASGPTTDLNVLAYLNGHYLAAGPRTSGTHEAIFESSDGLKWTQVLDSSNTGRIMALTYGNGVYVAAGDSGTVYTSSDAKTWIAGSPSLPAYMYGLAFGDGILVGVGSGGYVATSTDGKTWVQQSLPAPIADTLTGVVYTGSRFVAVVGSGLIYTSTDGSNWSLVGFTPPSGTSFSGVHWSGNRLVAVAEIVTSSSTLDYVAVSQDGLNWTGAYTGVAGVYFSDAFYDGSRYYAAAGSVPGGVYSSSDAQTWTLVPGVPGNAYVNAIVFQGGRYVTAGDQGDLLVAEAKAPTATSGSVTTAAGKAVTGTFAGSAASGAALTFSVVTQPSHGKVAIVDATAGTFKYTPDASFTGKDSFTFQVSDGVASSVPATEGVTVTAAAAGGSGGGKSSGGGGGAFPLLLSALLFGFAVRRR